MKSCLKIACVIMCVACLLCACGSPEAEVSPSPSPTGGAAPSPTPDPWASGQNGGETQQDQQDQQDRPAVEVEVVQSAAFFLPTISTPSLYGAVDIKNSTSAPVIIDEIRYVFSFGEESRTETVTPPLNASDIIGPGQTKSYAIWIDYDKEITPETQIAVSAKVTAYASEQQACPCALEAGNIMVLDNYPGFSTVSGTLTNPQNEDYAIVLVYFSFYDQSDKLLGVWHFAKNIAVPAGESRNFVTHMQTLPIPGLSEKAARIETRALGIS